MTRHYCDRCERQLPDDVPSEFILGGGPRFGVNRGEMCEECWESLRVWFLRPGKLTDAFFLRRNVVPAK